jgi:hypothetical protein
MNNEFIQNLITKYSKLTMNKENRTKLQNELIKNNLEHLYTETITNIFQKKVEYQQNNKDNILTSNDKLQNILNDVKNMTKEEYEKLYQEVKNDRENRDRIDKLDKVINENNNINNKKYKKYKNNQINKDYIMDKNNKNNINEEFADIRESDNAEKTFSRSIDVLSYERGGGENISNLELLKQRELDDTAEQYLLQKELLTLEKQILQTFKFLIEDLFNEETLKYDREITTLLKQMYKEGLEQGMKGEFNVYQLESILRQINQSDPTSKLKAVIEIYQKFKGDQSGNTVNILNQAGEIKVGGATHKVFNELEQTNFMDMVENMENDLSEKKENN